MLVFIPSVGEFVILELLGGSDALMIVNFGFENTHLHG